MTDPTLQNAEGIAAKAWAWLKLHWYAFGIGAAAGVLLGHLFWR